MCFFKGTSRKPTLTISLFDERMVITETTLPEKPITIALDARTIYQGILFKPSLLIAQLTSYLNASKLSLPTIMVHLPPSIDKSSPMLPFVVLQYALALSKISAKLTQITYSTDQNTTINLLELLLRQGHQSTKAWLTITILALCTLGIGVAINHRRITNLTIALIEQLKKLKSTNNSYEKQLAETNKLKMDITLLQEKDKATKKLLGKTNNPNSLLIAMAHQTPETIWLKSISFEKIINKKNILDEKPSKNPATQNPTSNNLVIIKGVSTSEGSISRLLQNLNRPDSGINHPLLVTVTKEKHHKKRRLKTKQRLYQFIIKGIPLS